MAKWDTITDDFPGSALGSLWEGGYGSWTVTGNRLRIATSGYSGPNTVNHDLSSSSVFWKNEPDTTGGYTGGTIRRSSGGVVIMTAYYKHGTPATLEIEYDNGGSAATVSLTYSATDHLWIRFRHSGSTVYCDTAPDGNTWTNRHTGACTAGEAGTVDVQLEAGPFPSSGSGYGYLSKLNLAPATGGPVALSGSSAGLATASGSLAVAKALTGSSSGSSTATGALGLAIPLAGSSSGTSTATGTLTNSVPLAGTAGGTSTATGTLEVAIGLAGTAAGVGSAAGTVAVQRALAGTSAGVGTATGSLNVSLSVLGTAYAWRYIPRSYSAGLVDRSYEAARVTRGYQSEAVTRAHSAGRVRRGYQAGEITRGS